MHVTLSLALTLDGFLDDRSTRRLILSNEEDFAKVDALRAAADAILVGARTIRRDDPRLLVRDASKLRGKGPLKVTLTRSGELDPASRFFTTGDAARLVFTPRDRVPFVQKRLGSVAEILPVELAPDVPRTIVAELSRRGVERLLIEGGAAIASLFLDANLVDTMRLAVAPFLLGEDGDARFGGVGRPICSSDRPARLVSLERLGDMVISEYAFERRTNDR